MTLGAAQILQGRAGWQIARLPGPDLAALLTGRAVEEAAALLPRLFNLCRMAQATAAQVTLGLPHANDTSAEVIRDHHARIFVTLRSTFDLAPQRPGPAGVLGPLNRLPRTMPELSAWLATPLPAAEMGRAVAQGFPSRLGVVPALPFPKDAVPGAFENSPAGRQASHPLLRAVEADQGRSPLWRYLGMLVDLEAARAGDLPPPLRLPDGTAVVQAARGAYALRMGQEGGVVTDLRRLTPTDHQLAAGGALSLALASLPHDRPDLAARLVALHDPCIPVTIAEVQHA